MSVSADRLAGTAIGRSHELPVAGHAAPRTRGNGPRTRAQLLAAWREKRVVTEARSTPAQLPRCLAEILKRGTEHGQDMDGQASAGRSRQGARVSPREHEDGTRYEPTPSAAEKADGFAAVMKRGVAGLDRPDLAHVGDGHDALFDDVGEHHAITTDRQGDQSGVLVQLTCSLA